mgnify:CR=1 FL=1
MMESMNRRLTKLYADIDQRYEDQIDNILSVVVENESATRKLAKKAMKNSSVHSSTVFAQALAELGCP